LLGLGRGAERALIPVTRKDLARSVPGVAADLLAAGSAFNSSWVDVPFDRVTTNGRRIETRW
jgi:hypothetical protein